MQPGVEAIGEIIEDNRENLRAMVTHLLHLRANFQKDRLGSLRHACEEAEHRFWQAQRRGDLDAGFHQSKWGEALVKLQEAEGSLRHCMNVIRGAEANEAGPEP